MAEENIDYTAICKEISDILAKHSSDLCWEDSKLPHIADFVVVVAVEDATDPSAEPRYHTFGSSARHRMLGLLGMADTDLRFPTEEEDDSEG